jgi:hypothetical protein
MLSGTRRDFLRRESARRVANHALFIAQRQVHLSTSVRLEQRSIVPALQRWTSSDDHTRSALGRQGK